jgi:hypothetical protein
MKQLHLDPTRLQYATAMHQLKTLNAHLDNLPEWYGPARDAALTALITQAGRVNQLRQKITQNRRRRQRK